MEWLWIYDQQCIQQLMQNKDLLLYFESFLSIINKRNPTNIVGYERKVESMSNHPDQCHPVSRKRELSAP